MPLQLDEDLQQKVNQAIAAGAPQDMAYQRALAIQQTRQQPQTQPDSKYGMMDKVNSAVLNIAKELVAPFLRSAQKQATQYATPGLNVMKEQDVSKETLGDALQIASWTVPFGRGGNIATKALLPGAAVGATMETGSQLSSGEQLNPSDILKAGELGLLTAGATHGITSGINRLSKGGQKAGKAIEGTGANLTQSQYALPRSMSKNLKMKDTVGNLSRYGITDINKVSEVAPKVTGAEGAITVMNRNAVGKVAEPIDTAGILDLAKNLADDPLMPAGVDKKFYNFVKKLLAETKGSGNATAAIEGNALNTFEAIQKLQKQAFAIGGKSAQLTANEQALKSAYLSVASELEDRLYGKVTNEMVQNTVTPELLTQLEQVSPLLAQDVQKASTIAERRALAAPFVRGGKAAEFTNEASNQVFAGKTKMGDMLPSLTDPLMPARTILNSNTASARAGSALGKLGRGMQKATNVKIGEQPINVLESLSARVPTINANQGQNQQGQTPPSQQPNGQGIQENINHNLLLSPNNIAQPTKKVNITGYSLEELGNAWTQAMTAGDNASAAKIKQLYDMENSYQKQSTPKNVTAATAKMQWQAEAGARGLEEAIKMIEADPNLPIKGFVSKNLATRQYQNAIFRATENILRLQTGANAPQNEVERYAKQLFPWVGDDKSTVEYKLQQLSMDYANLQKIMGSQDITPTSTETNVGGL